jgi:signal transduction histidine kinase
MGMVEKLLSEENRAGVIVISGIVLMFSMGIVLLIFFYFSKKKIIQKELEKKNLELEYQKELLQATIITQEVERKRIAQDLHDDISSKLNIVSLNSHLLSADNLTKDEVNEITANIINLTTKALDNSRRIAHDLLPPVLDNFGLHAAIEELCVEFISSKSVSVDYQNQVEFVNLEKDKHLHIFRILQELMNNSLRHGKATNISILFEDNNGSSACRYNDNGCGFDMKNEKNRKGLGMKNIESRITFLNGTMSIDSAINQGIEVVFNF